MNLNDRSEVEKLINKSGNKLHSNVVRFFKDKKWDVIVSPYYSDNFTDKPREIDIIARKKFEINNIFDDLLGILNVNLFIECKYVDKKTVFWFDAKDEQNALKRVERDISIDPSINHELLKHHYLTENSVAKLSFSENDNQNIEKAINQSLNALIYYRDKSDFVFNNPDEVPVLGTIFYPIIMTNSFDNFYRTDIVDNTIINYIVDQFQLEVNYAYTDKNHKRCNEYFLIDVVDFSNLEKFINDLLKTDIEPIKEKIGINLDKKIRRER